jgi:hypothetical protein
MQARGGGWDGECGWFGGGGGGGREMSSDHVPGAGFAVVGVVACLRMLTVV